MNIKQIIMHIDRLQQLRYVWTSYEININITKDINVMFNFEIKVCKTNNRMFKVCSVQQPWI